MKHTPAPWRVSLGDLVTGPNGEHIADCERTPHAERPKPPTLEDMANAHLIAAAPELLEALERAVEHHVPKINPFADAAILSAAAAIKKAKGE